MKPHAFIAMPFGDKPGAGGKPVRFNRIFDELLKPALEAAGLTVFRADQEMRGGDIRFDMFQELLVADLVVADLTVDNPNVWYELGVRHALRARGVLLVQGPRKYQPFDIYTDRKYNYALKDGAPDPDRLAADIAAIAQMARATLAAPNARKVSPVYALLTHLREPHWGQLLLAEKNEFSEVYGAWQARMEVARQRLRPGDILVLADETPTLPLRLEAKRAAGNSLLALRHYGFALEQFDAALALDPNDKPSREKKAVCLGRVQPPRFEDAQEWVRGLTRDYPTDAEVWSLAGRVAKDKWTARWRIDGSSDAQMREAAAAASVYLDEAATLYASAFVADPSHHYSAINAVTLLMLQQHLGGEVDRARIDALIGGAAWAVASAQLRDKQDYWARASAAELALLTRAKAEVQKAYSFAAAAADRNWFALDSTRQTLVMLGQLGFRPEETAAALQVLDLEYRLIAPPFDPRQVWLFSGHRVDAPDRAVPRFPASKEADAARAIGDALDAQGAGPGDLAVCQAAAGGDLLFLEACRQRGVRALILLPFKEPEFIGQSVAPGSDGERWRERFYAAKAAQPQPTLRVMPDELGPCPDGVDPYERCNLWLLYTALAFGDEKTRFICLWNGSGGDGPGGTQHMYQEVNRRTGRVTWIDTKKL